MSQNRVKAGFNSRERTKNIGSGNKGMEFGLEKTRQPNYWSWITYRSVFFLFLWFVLAVQQLRTQLAISERLRELRYTSLQPRLMLQYSTNTNINIPHPVNIPPFIVRLSSASIRTREKRYVDGKWKNGKNLKTEISWHFSFQFCAVKYNGNIHIVQFTWLILCIGLSVEGFCSL